MYFIRIGNHVENKCADRYGAFIISLYVAVIAKMYLSEYGAECVFLHFISYDKRYNIDLIA